MVLTKAILHVHGGSSTLQDTEGLDDSLRHTVLRLVNVEVAQRAVLTQSVSSYSVWLRIGVIPLGLRTPVLVSWDLSRDT